jgi:hypothetical protein
MMFVSQEWAFEQGVKLPSIKKSRFDYTHVCYELKSLFDFNLLRDPGPIVEFTAILLPLSTTISCGISSLAY